MSNGMYNPKTKLAESSGVDLPILYVYLAGRIAGNAIDKCLGWRQEIVEYYKNYKGRGTYPIAFLDPLNSKESDSVDQQGLTSAIPPNLIYDKDLLSVDRADVVVAMMDDYMEAGIEKYLDDEAELSTIEFIDGFFKLKKAIKERRPNWGTYSEVAWALKANKPLILICTTSNQKSMLECHPFTKRASVVVGSVEELLEKKWLQILYKSIAGATY